MRFLSLLLFLAPGAAHAADTLTGKLDHTVKASPDGQIEIENLCGDITVLGTDAAQIRIRGEVAAGAELHVYADANDARIEVRPTPRARREVYCATLELEVPKASHLEIEAVASDLKVGQMTDHVELASVSGDIQLGPGAKRVEIEAVSGDVQVVGVSQELDIEAVSGGVTAMDAGPRVDIECVSGSVDVQGNLERINVESVSGSLTLTGSISPSGRVSLESHSGNVTLVVPASTRARFEMETFSGRLRSSMGGQPERHGTGPGSSHRFAMGEGGASVTITTFSGNAEVRTSR